MAGWVHGDSGSFERDTLDSKIYEWATKHAKSHNIAVFDPLAQRLHDHAIDDALSEHLSAYPDVVAVMGGHSMLGTDPTCRTVAELGLSMARAGWHVATGGGPGAMEAANLGAWLALHWDGALDAALEMLMSETDFRESDGYLGAGQGVLDAFPDGAESLAVPTWFYRHEPTNQFLTHVAKHFANSIRKDGLLAIATRGVVFSPGACRDDPRSLPGRHSEPLRRVWRGEPDGVPRQRVLDRDAAGRTVTSQAGGGADLRNNDWFC
jgi:hypothetical protein